MSTGITPLDPQQTAVQESKAVTETYIHRVLVAFDIFINVLFRGHPGETISSRASRAATEGKKWGVVLSKFLDLFQKDHGATAQAADEQRAETVEYLEESSGNIGRPKE
jgi:hypothetical protein